MRQPKLSHDRLLALLVYDRETGLFRWRQRHRGKLPGNVAGYVKQNGRREIEIDRERIRAAKLAWFYVTGSWPEKIIDHIDCNSLNEAFENLRECDDTQNQANRRRAVNNTSGFKGVTKVRSGRWPYRAQITCRGKFYSLGFFNDPKEAHAAYVAKARELFGEFARAA